ncbi:hypothetical protein ACFWR9_42670 [Streptomyces sp. NPDC058534]|uniref:hypothetical protein n=1 Tax=Streptomyces sp. NPDC058534 TaxID=3346541 RepID=UPI003666DCF6
MAYEFSNKTYPQLQITSTAGKARFADGAFSTEDEALGEALRALPDWYGVHLVNAPDEGPEDPPGDGEGSGDGPDDVQRPARSANKAEWAEYARSHAADSDEVNEINTLTKEQLIEQYGEPADG